jgi:5-bromo-4-chloroindolyl phosphate hydrolysis protein
MSSILYLLGAINIIVSIICGVSTGTIKGFLITAFTGVLKTILLFGIGNIIDNQDTIISYLNGMKDNKTGVLKKCGRCNKEYEFYRKSCPYCGNKD